LKGLRIVSHNKKLTKEEEKELVLRAQKGCEEAKNEVIRVFERIVYDIVNKLKLTRDVEDVIQIGLMGITKAMLSYNPSDKAKFSTYAYRTAFGELLKYFRSNHSVHLPRSIVDNQQKIKSEMNKYSREHGNEPSKEEILQLTKLTEEEYFLAIGAKGTCLSLTQPLKGENKGEKDTTLQDSIRSDEEIYERVEWSYVLGQLSQKWLTEKEREILYLRFTEDMTQTEVAQLKGITQTTISRTEKNAIGKLRDKFDKQAM